MTNNYANLWGITPRKYFTRPQNSVTGVCEVFICCAPDDRECAEALMAALEANSVTCALSPAVSSDPAAAAKQSRIAIDKCRAAVVILSAAADTGSSPDICKLYRQQLIHAISSGKVLIPFALDSAPRSDVMDFMLVDLRQIPAFPDRESAVRKLVQKVCSLPFYIGGA